VTAEAVEVWQRGQREQEAEKEERMAKMVKGWLLRRLLEQYCRSKAADDGCKQFEDRLGRTYFHNSPLSPEMVQAWAGYAAHEENQGRPARAANVYRRALVAGNGHLNLWQLYWGFLRRQGQTARLLHGVQQALRTALEGRPDWVAAAALHLEGAGEVNAALEVLTRACKRLPQILLLHLRRVQAETRQKGAEAGFGLALEILAQCSPSVTVGMAQHAALLCVKFRLGEEAASRVRASFEIAMSRCPPTADLALTLLEFESRADPQRAFQRAQPLVECFMAREDVDPASKARVAVTFAKFADELCSDPVACTRAELEAEDALRAMETATVKAGIKRPWVGNASPQPPISPAESPLVPAVHSMVWQPAVAHLQQGTALQQQASMCQHAAAEARQQLAYYAEFLR